MVWVYMIIIEKDFTLYTHTPTQITNPNQLKDVLTLKVLHRKLHSVLVLELQFHISYGTLMYIVMNDPHVYA